MSADLMNPGLGTAPMPRPEVRRQAAENGMAWREFFFGVQMVMAALAGRAKDRPPVLPNPFDGLP